jgi:CBS domain-containing protein
MLLPLMLAVSIAYGLTVLVLKRSILTEKIARRGFHLSREYAIDPLEILFVREVMQASIGPMPLATGSVRFIVAYPDEPLRVVVHRMAETGLTCFPVVERETRALVGMVSLEHLLKARAKNLDAEHRRERVREVRVLFPFGLGRSGEGTP